MRANWGLKAEAMRERIRGSELELRFRVMNCGEWGAGMKESSRREVRYWVRLEEISERV